MRTRQHTFLHCCGELQSKPANCLWGQAVSRSLRTDVRERVNEVARSTTIHDTGCVPASLHLSAIGPAKYVVVPACSDSRGSCNGQGRWPKRSNATATGCFGRNGLLTSCRPKQLLRISSCAIVTSRYACLPFWLWRLERWSPWRTIRRATSCSLASGRTMTLKCVLAYFNALLSSF